MQGKDILMDLFDKKIVSVLDVFLKNSDQRLSLTEVAQTSKNSFATTLRILDKLLNKGFIEISPVGKSKFYKLSRNEKTMVLNRFLQKEDARISEFVEKLKKSPRINTIVLESKTDTSAKLLIVGNYVPTDIINYAVNEIRKKYNFKIQFVELTDAQYQDMRKIYNLDNKVIWEKEN